MKRLLAILVLLFPALALAQGPGIQTYGKIPAVIAGAKTFTTSITVPQIYGSAAANGDITIEGTASATKTTSYVILQPTGGNVGIGTATPAVPLDVVGETKISTNAWVGTSVLSGASVTVGLSADLTNITGTAPKIVAVTSGAVNQHVALVANAANGSSPAMSFFKTRTVASGAAVDANATIETGDSLGALNFYGADGTDYINSASITVQSTGAIEATRVPSKMMFQTSTNAAPSVKTTALTIDENQRVGIGTTAPDQLLHVEQATANTVTSVYPLRLTQTTSGAAGTAFGVGLEFELETATSPTNHLAGSLRAQWTDATAASEDSKLVFSTTIAGTETDVAELSGANFDVTGKLTGGAYVVTPPDAAYTVLAQDYRRGVIFNSSQTAARIYNLRDGVINDIITFTVAAAYTMTVNPDDTDTIVGAGLACAAGDSIISDTTIGTTVTLIMHKANTWMAYVGYGSWTDNN